MYILYMNLIILFTYLFKFKNYKSKELLGNDERFPLKEEKIFMPKIIENYKKKELLDYLRSNDINILIKVDAVNKFNNYNIPKQYNLSNGGLLDKWNFEF